MKMRHKRRVLVARTTPLAGLDELLAPVRRARLALLRNPTALAEVKALIKRMKGPGAKLLHQMLTDDLTLMGQLDREDRRQAALGVLTPGNA